MLSINTFLLASTMKMLRCWEICYCTGVAISRVFGGSGFLPTTFISALWGDFDVQSDHLSKICQCLCHGG